MAVDPLVLKRSQYGSTSPQLTGDLTPDGISKVIDRHALIDERPWTLAWFVGDVRRVLSRRVGHDSGHRCLESLLQAWRVNLIGTVAEEQRVVGQSKGQDDQRGVSTRPTAASSAVRTTGAKGNGSIEGHGVVVLSSGVYARVSGYPLG